MKTAAILGAGYMASAMTFPLAANGITPRLWGTWLDDELIASSRTGEHPRLKKPLPESTVLFDSSDLGTAVEGAECIFIGVSSEGFVPVFSRLLEVLTDAVPIFALTKGFSVLDGRVMRTSEAGRELFGRRFGAEALVWTSIGGPVKAYELAREIPSPAIFGTQSDEAARTALSLQTDYYRVRTTGDVAGVELSSALKNIYAMAIGMCDGLYGERMARNYHNFNSLLFNQAILEMAMIVEAESGDAATVHDLAGIGDLYVTAQSGKNQHFGRLVGTGLAPEEAYRKMESEDLLAEGFLALKAGTTWLAENHPGLIERLPLFATLKDICLDGAPVEESLREMVRTSL